MLLSRDMMFFILGVLKKKFEECKKRWRGLRDGYMRSKRVGAVHRTKAGVFEKLQFLDGLSTDSAEEVLEEGIIMEDGHQLEETIMDTEQVITDNQEYYEITVVDGPQKPSDIIKNEPFIKILPKTVPEKKIVKKNVGRKKSTPMPRNIAPIKILPKPISCLMSGPKIVGYVEDQKTPEQRSQVIDKLIEKVLKENTNEIDVFFRSMAASVKKLQPNLIPKVKMEVCNVIAKYEMQSFDRHMQ
ncbi:uncharacterized protein LOC126376297 isoform X2 [Pectinophora gossypiella]|uniref:uncharacterized protein LOC126376297 isoform X2 n=1 Tax=Pectinophora gossypiella TaxID=13191 RepID=UPI00214DF9FF|nr:uncharacterized protein LOC126376297 isoform X2 [Pectinophora gossypiella]